MLPLGGRSVPLPPQRRDAAAVAADADAGDDVFSYWGEKCTTTTPN